MNEFSQLNRVILRGYVGNVRLNSLNGTKVARFSVATSLAYMDADSRAQIETTWHSCVAFEGRCVKDLDSLTKGTPVCVTGRIRYVKYTDQDGAERTTCEVLVTELLMIQADSMAAETK